MYRKTAAFLTIIFCMSAAGCTKQEVHIDQKTKEPLVNMQTSREKEGSLNQWIPGDLSITVPLPADAQKVYDKSLAQTSTLTDTVYEDLETLAYIGKADLPGENANAYYYLLHQKNNDGSDKYDPYLKMAVVSVSGDSFSCIVHDFDLNTYAINDSTEKQEKFKELEDYGSTVSMYQEGYSQSLHEAFKAEDLLKEDDYAPICLLGSRKKQDDAKEEAYLCFETGYPHAAEKDPHGGAHHFTVLTVRTDAKGKSTLISKHCIDIDDYPVSELAE